jgi:hypothetical protein
MMGALQSHRGVQRLYVQQTRLSILAIYTTEANGTCDSKRLAPHLPSLQSQVIPEILLPIPHSGDLGVPHLLLQLEDAVH